MTTWLMIVCVGLFACDTPITMMQTTEEQCRAVTTIDIVRMHVWCISPSGIVVYAETKSIPLVPPAKENATSAKEGTLQMQPSGRWAIYRPGHAPVEIPSGELFRIEVAGELKLTRMEFRRFTGPMKGRTLRGQPGEYYSVDNYPLRDGLRAALP